MYGYDQIDRLVASKPEPEWDEVEQNWMLALAEYEAALCPSCGGPITECTAVENDGRFKVGLPVRCHRTTAIAIASEKAEHKHPQALMYSAEYNPA